MYILQLQKQLKPPVRNPFETPLAACCGAWRIPKVLRTTLFLHSACSAWPGIFSSRNRLQEAYRGKYWKLESGNVVQMQNLWLFKILPEWSRLLWSLNHLVKLCFWSPLLPEQPQCGKKEPCLTSKRQSQWRFEPCLVSSSWLNKHDKTHGSQQRLHPYSLYRLLLAPLFQGWPRLAEKKEKRKFQKKTESRVFSVCLWCLLFVESNEPRFES